MELLFAVLIFGLIFGLLVILPEERRCDCIPPCEDPDTTHHHWR